jgi:hypothetical protein
MNLRLDWCTTAAARWALAKWYHYPNMPSGKVARIGVWEDEKFIGVVLFGSGANPDLGTPYGLKCTECCEMVRVAMGAHKSPVSRIVRIAVLLLKRAFSGLRLIVSFSDPIAGHVGGIYQAGNWVYAGMTTASPEYIFQGRRYQGRAMRMTLSGKGMMDVKFGKNTLERIGRIDPEAQQVSGSAKHRYLLPLDDEMRVQLEALKQKYPKRVGSETVDTSVVQTEKGGATPTSTLQTS